MARLSGTALFLDRSDINTDEIIPAKYLTESSKDALKPFALEDLKLPGFEAQRDLPGKSVVVTRANFGCGSSREHAVWALEVNGVSVVIAENYARIFRTNMFNCGLLAIELPSAELDKLFAMAGPDTTIDVDLAARRLTCVSGAASVECAFTLNPWDATLVEAGGWVEYADSKY